MYNSKTSINQDKWFEIITDDGVIDLNKIDGIIVDIISKTHPNGTTETTDLASVDGSVPEFTTYGSYDLEVSLLARGIDKPDVDLLIFKLNNLLSKRKAYYVRHSDLPSIKYAVLPTPKIESDRKTRNDYEITVTFECYKGYSESYKTVQQMNLLDGTWQFEEGAVFDDDVKYTHETNNFYIYNGSPDTIDPLINHYLYIKVNADAPDGLKIINNTTEQELEFSEPLKVNDDFVLDGVYPILNGKRVGRYTNFEFIKLAPGYNSISIYGDAANKPKSHWDFNFLFR